MYILRNMAGAELNAYTKQSTAKALTEKIRKDAVCIPKGDRAAAASYAADRGTGRQEAFAQVQDSVKISEEGRALQGKEANISLSGRRLGETGRYVVQFENPAMLRRAVKQGYIEMEGKKVELSDEVKKQLLATDQQVRKMRGQVAMRNFMMHEAANARQSSDAMKEANDKMSRAMATASRIMHGRKVSPADEKELMEFNKDLYAMAKNSAVFAKHRSKKQDEEDEKISAKNDEAREREAAPRDYRVEEIPMPRQEPQMTVSLEGDEPQVLSVGAGMPVG